MAQTQHPEAPIPVETVGFLPMIDPEASVALMLREAEQLLLGSYPFIGGGQVVPVVRDHLVRDLSPFAR